MNPTPEQLTAALELGRRMRRAQKDYFRWRDNARLRASKALEQEFDAAILLTIGAEGDLPL